MKLIIGNKAYSSWSLRGWLAAKQSGLPFDEITVPLYDDSWDERKREEDLAPSSGKVPILWDGDAVIWDSLAIMEYLADKVGRERYWPKDEVARGMARSMAAEMHSGYISLRRECPMNIRKKFEDVTITEEPAATRSVCCKPGRRLALVSGAKDHICSAPSAPPTSCLHRW